MKKKCFFQVWLLFFPLVVFCQQVKIKNISLKNFPLITAILSVESEKGSPLFLKSRKLFLLENEQQINNVKITPVESDTNPIFTVLILDKSGSMKGTGIQMAKEGAIYYTELMKEGDKTAYIEFDSKVQTVMSFSHLKSELKKKIKQTRVGSDTALIDAIQCGIELYGQSPQKSVKVIIVLTDGKENRSKHRLDEVLAAARKLGISIYTIGLGEKINPDMLKTIARNTEGNYYYAVQPADLIKIYKRVSQLLHSQFLIEFESPLPMDDCWHQLRVEITYSEGVVKGERSYLSAKESFIPTKWLKAIKASELKRIGGKKKRLQEAIQKETKIRQKQEDNLIVFLSITLGLLVLLLLILILFKKRR